MRYATRTMLALLSTVLLFAAGLAAQKTDSAQALLRAAMDKAVVDGDLNAAIKQYQAIVDKYLKTDRGAAATALLRMADCYQKLGNEAEASRLYQRVMRDFADQTESASQARARLAILAQNRSSEPRPPGEHVAVTIRELRLESTQPSPRLSPDGNKIVYTKRGGNLFVRDLVSGVEKQATDVKTGTAYNPAWSPDGKRIVYTHWHNYWKYEMRIVSLDTGEDQHREINGHPWDWSKDGRYILYSEGGAEKPLATLNLLPVQGGPVKEITRIDTLKQSVAPAGLSLSPDGKYVAYSLENNRTSSSLFLLPTERGEPTQITDGSAYDYQPIWGPDGKSLSFVSNRSFGRFDLWSLPVRDGKVAGEPSVVKPDIGRVRLLSLTQNGRLLYSRTEARSHIYVTEVDPETGQAIERATKLTSDSASGDTQRQRPVWSPDGRQIAYIVSRNTFRVMSPDGSNDREIARPPGMFLGPFAWDPDNDHIYFAGKPPVTGSGIYSVSVSTKEIKLVILDAELVGWVSCSPDGKHLAFLKGLQQPQIFVADVTGKNLPQVTFETNSNRLYPGAWSPDGKRFTYANNVGSGKTSLIVLTLDDGGVHELLGGTKDFVTLSWSPDGGKLAWWAQSEQGPEIQVLRLAPGEKPQVFRPNGGFPTNARMLDPSWAPDGKKVAFAAGTVTDQLVLMENFLPKPDAADKR